MPGRTTVKMEPVPAALACVKTPAESVNVGHKMTAVSAEPSAVAPVPRHESCMALSGALYGD
jgi:hypothetical protein